MQVPSQAKRDREGERNAKLVHILQMRDNLPCVRATHKALNNLFGGENERKGKREGGRREERAPKHQDSL